ncbi:low temperature requirement protein A [Pseudarthrobacter sp. P1]|uniref:low temperature requirement protein A n=1 Tax=Pseudarthrobacter sp. P1 TaxID=3418418 RepID=UPI003CEEB68D
MFAIIWAWINFSWFASAYDTDDWIFRVVTMVQMVGVLVLAMGIEPLFASIIEGRHVDNRVMVLGYVVMRVALLFQWLRAAKQDPERRSVTLGYARYLAVAQLGRVAVILVDTTVPLTLLMAVPLFALEMATPVLAERTSRTAWHAHHIAERYSLLAIIALGECLIGTIDTLRAVVSSHGWSLDTAVVGLAGTGLAFGLWWVYLIFASIAATGAGLHVFAYYLQHKTHIGEPPWWPRWQFPSPSSPSR